MTPVLVVVASYLSNVMEKVFKQKLENIKSESKPRQANVGILVLTEEQKRESLAREENLDYAAFKRMNTIQKEYYKVLATVAAVKCIKTMMARWV